MNFAARVTLPCSSGMDMKTVLISYCDVKEAEDIKTS